MAANRFVLVPEDVYQGFTSTDTGNINLDYSRRMLENVKREKINSATKNARYNQELRRYLHLRKEYENKPVKVELAGAPNLRNILANTVQRTTTQNPIVQIAPIVELSKEFFTRIKADPAKFQVTTEGRIKNDHGRVIEGSDIKKSLNWIIANEKGLKAGPRPKGTMNLENQIRRDDSLLHILQNINRPGSSNSFPSPIGTSTPKTQFKVNKW